MVAEPTPQGQVAGEPEGSVLGGGPQPSLGRQTSKVPTPHWLLGSQRDRAPWSILTWHLDWHFCFPLSPCLGCLGLPHPKQNCCASVWSGVCF